MVVNMTDIIDGNYITIYSRKWDCYAELKVYQTCL